MKWTKKKTAAVDLLFVPTVIFALFTNWAVKNPTVIAAIKHANRPPCGGKRYESGGHDIPEIENYAVMDLIPGIIRGHKLMCTGNSGKKNDSIPPCTRKRPVISKTQWYFYYVNRSRNNGPSKSCPVPSALLFYQRFRFATNPT